MKKRLLSILCALAVMISVMPMQMAMAAEQIYLISGQPFNGTDKSYYEAEGYQINYYPRNTAVSYTWDAASEEAQTLRDPNCIKMNNGNVGTYTTDAIWTGDDQISYWDLGGVYPLNKVDIWSRYYICNIKVYVSTTGNAEDYTLAKSYQSSETGSGDDTCRYTPIEFDATPARYVKLVVSSKSDDGITNFGKSVVRQVFMFTNTDMNRYYYYYHEAEKMIESGLYTDESVQKLKTILDTADNTVMADYTTAPGQSNTIAHGIKDLVKKTTETKYLLSNNNLLETDFSYYLNRFGTNVVKLDTGADYKWQEEAAVTADASMKALTAGTIVNFDDNKDLWLNATSTATFDLKDVYSVSRIDVFTRFVYDKYNMKLPASITLSFSTNDETYTEPVTYSYDSYETARPDVAVQTINFEAVDARYVKVTYNLSQSQIVLFNTCIFSDINEKDYKDTLTKAKAEVGNSKWTSLTKEELAGVIATAEEAVAAEKTQEVLDAQTAELKKALNNLAYHSSAYVKKQVISGNIENTTDISRYRDHVGYDISYINDDASYTWTEGYFYENPSVDNVKYSEDNIEYGYGLRAGNVWVASADGSAWGKWADNAQSTSYQTDTLVWDLKSVYMLEEIDFFQRVTRAEQGVKSVKIEVSTDGVNYTPVGEYEWGQDLYRNYSELSYLPVIIEPVKAKYVKITFDRLGYKQYALTEVVMFGSVPPIETPVTVTDAEFKDYDGNILESLNGITDLVTGVTLYNETDEKISGVTAFTAIYDKSGKLVAATKSESVDIAAKSSTTAPVECEIENLSGITDEHEVKVFLWQDMKPVGAITEFTK